ncbi:hypothetical protein ACT2FY_37650 [Paraburkholderia fungorum]|jgi:hypothetical protein|uniref:hypothetical protein n=1 Tax=Paraburkholderia fungorum TaxID=134537 RepID=UPI00402BDCBF
MAKALRISFQAFADLSDNELSDVIREACDHSRAETRMYTDTDRDAHRARKRRQAQRDRTVTNDVTAASQPCRAA